MQTYVVPVLFRVTGEDARDVERLAGEAFADDERAVHVGTPLIDTGCESFAVEVSDADARPLRTLEPAQRGGRKALETALRDFESAANALAIVAADQEPDVHRRVALRARRLALRVRDGVREERD